MQKKLTKYGNSFTRIATSNWSVEMMSREIVVHLYIFTVLGII